MQKKNNWGLIIGGCAIMLLALLIWRINTSVTNEQVEEITETTVATDEMAAAESEYYSMTIPYLRGRDYVSQLGEREYLRETAEYEVYLTDYDSDGYKVYGLLTIPKGEMPEGGWPAIVFIHGYQNPQTYQTDGQSYSAYWAYLARQGFVIFKIDLRGHGDSEGVWAPAYFSGEEVVDTLNAYAALEQDSEVNPDKIYLWGHSMAGNLVLRAAAARPEIPKAAIWAGAVYTYTDFQEYGIDDPSVTFNRTSPPPSEASESGRSNWRRLMTDGINNDDPFWQTTVPTNYLNEIKTEIALFHAVNDDVVSIEYSRNLVNLAASSSANITLHEYPTGGHNITSPSFNRAMSETVEFLK